MIFYRRMAPWLLELRAGGMTAPTCGRAEWRALLQIGSVAKRFPQHHRIQPFCSPYQRLSYEAMEPVKAVSGFWF